MIRFSCPTCQTAFETPETSAGVKFFCSNCGQKIQVPAPPPTTNKTVLGTLNEPQIPVGSLVLPDSDSSLVPLEPAELPVKKPESRKGFRCPFCGSRKWPVWETKVSTGGWILFVVGIVFLPFFGLGAVLIILGLLTKDKYMACNHCGAKLHGVVSD